MQQFYISPVKLRKGYALNTIELRNKSTGKAIEEKDYDMILDRYISWLSAKTISKKAGRKVLAGTGYYWHVETSRRYGPTYRCFPNCD